MRRRLIRQGVKSHVCPLSTLDGEGTFEKLFCFILFVFNEIFHFRYLRESEMSHFPRELLHVSNGKELPQKNVRAWDCTPRVLLKDTLAPQKRSLSFPPEHHHQRFPTKKGYPISSKNARSIPFFFKTEFNSFPKPILIP